MPAISSRVLNAIVWGGLTVAALDGIEGAVFFGTRGVTVMQFFQSVASGFLGSASYRGGLPTALLGLLLHCCVALGAATAYVLVSLKFPILLRNALLYGPLFGIAFYFFMNRVVIPLSAFPVRPNSVH